MVPFRTRWAELNDSTAFAFSSNIRNHILTRLRKLLNAFVILFVFPVITPTIEFRPGTRNVRHKLASPWARAWPCGSQGTSSQEPFPWLQPDYQLVWTQCHMEPIVVIGVSDSIWSLDKRSFFEFAICGCVTTSLQFGRWYSILIHTLSPTTPQSWGILARRKMVIYEFRQKMV